MAKLIFSLAFLIIFVGFYINLSVGATSYNVLTYGARPNGVTDSTKAFVDAWAAACASTAPFAMIYVPKGRYLVGAMVFKGPCSTPSIIFRIDGTLQAPRDYKILGNAFSWLSFEGVDGVSILGGSLDAKGSSLWACKSKSSNCPSGTTSLTFTNSNNIKIKGLLSLNSQMFHIVINGCKDVYVENVKVLADGNSPNTDGFHVQFSKNVAIFNSSIKTGDDCISIGPGTKDLWVEGVRCGPGHGISIGSLAKSAVEEGVQNVTVKRTIFVGSTNGFRIKSWARPSTGFVQRVRFVDAIMQNVQNPIIIDQHYCPHNSNCPTEVSGVKISDIVYEGIRGTSATEVAMKFDCSSKYPCEGIKLSNVKLTHSTRQVQTFCAHALGKTIGIVRPQSCL